MTATDELRRLLDERGVEHYDGTESTLWGYEDYNESAGVYRFSADETSDGYMQMRLWHVTPAQAIAATLGDVPHLPYWWTHDGTLHIELPKLPESISVRLPDQRDREVGSARTWQYTHGSGTCHMEYCDEWSGDELYPTEAYVCSACSYVTVDGKPNYCPNCGREAVDE